MLKSLIQIAGKMPSEDFEQAVRFSLSIRGGGGDTVQGKE